MAEYQNVIVFLVASLAAIAVAWGIIKSEVSTMRMNYTEHRNELAELKREVGRDLVGKEHCREIHARGMKDYDEMKGDLKKINDKLDMLLMRSKA